MVYPEKIANQLVNIRGIVTRAETNAVGTGASFSCGSFVRFSIVIDGESPTIMNADFKSNGCGFMIAVADVLTQKLIRRRLTDLHGLTDHELDEIITTELGAIPNGRIKCIDACFHALHAALADYRTSRIEEFAGEKALLCTCFGVTEERIEAVIRENSIGSVDDVSAVCNAGLGCGSCRMMIDEMIDAHASENDLVKI